MIERATIRDILVDGWRPLAWLAGLVILVYGVSCGFGLTYLDDNEFVLDNYAFNKDLANAGAAFCQTIFSNPNVPYYRPLLALSFMVDAQLAGAAAHIYHVTNIVLHAAAACLVFLLIMRLIRRRDAAFMLAAVFAVHPALAQAVAWIPGRNDLLLGVCALLAFLAFLRYCDSRKLADYIATLACFGAALFVKESALILAGLFIIYLWLERDRIRLGADEAVVIGGWAAVAAFWYLFRASALISSCDRSTFTGVSGAVYQSMPAYIQYLGKAFFPFNLSVYPTIADTGFVWAGMAVIAMAALVALSRCRDWKLIMFGTAWFTLFLVSTFVRPSPECVLDFQEHRLYLPFIGLVILLSGLGPVARLDLRDRRTQAFFGTLMALFALLAVRHQMNFRDQWSFWKNATETSPGAAYIHLRAGFIYHLNGATDMALGEYLTALKLDPELTALHIKLGLIYLDQGRLDDAAREFREEIRISPQFDMGYMCLGVVRYRQGRADEAERLWKKALRINKHGIDARKNLAILYAERNDMARAALYAEELVGLGVGVPEVFLKKVKAAGRDGP